MDDPNKPVRIPRELLQAPQQQLEVRTGSWRGQGPLPRSPRRPDTPTTFSPPHQEYTRNRIMQFALAFSARVSPNLSLQVVQRAAFETVAQLPPPEAVPAGGIEARDLQLVFRHDCL